MLVDLHKCVWAHRVVVLVDLDIEGRHVVDWLFVAVGDRCKTPHICIAFHFFAFSVCESHIDGVTQLTDPNVVVRLWHHDDRWTCIKQSVVDLRTPVVRCVSAPYSNVDYWQFPVEWSWNSVRCDVVDWWVVHLLVSLLHCCSLVVAVCQLAFRPLR